MTEVEFDEKWEKKWEELNRKLFKLIRLKGVNVFSEYTTLEYLKDMLSLSEVLEVYEASAIIFEAIKIRDKFYAKTN